MASNSYTITIPYASGKKHLNEEITIEDLYRISEPVIDNAIKPIWEALDKADLKKEDLDLVLLAGGSSQLPGVYEKIRTALNIEPKTIPKNLMLAISYGAALRQREIFDFPAVKREVRSLGYSIGIEVKDGGKHGAEVLLNYNQILPAEKSFSFYVDEGQETATINLVTLAYDSNRIEKRLKQRNIKLSAGASKLNVDIKVTENRLIELSVSDARFPDDKSILQVDNRVLSDSDIRNKQIQLGIEVVNYGQRSTLQPCIGIDLGTTTSEIAYTNRTGEIELHCIENPEVPSQYSSYCFPSVVYFMDGTNKPEIANTKACDAMDNADDADKVAYNFKIAPRNKYVLEVNGEGKTVSDLSALMISKIWSIANTTFSDMNLKSAVVTVPAAFDFDACQETLEAAKVAGIEDVILIDEPTAAYIYYKHMQDLDESKIRNVLVFDFGGGTADVSILDIKHSDKDSTENKDCLYEVLSVSGDEHCGGKLVDEALVTEVKKRFEEKNDCKISAKSLRTLRSKVENAKEVLSENYAGMDEI